MALLLKIVDINSRNYSSAVENQSAKTLTVGEKRGNIYDRSYNLLVNRRSRLIAAVTPVTGVSEYLKDYFTTEELTEKISDGYPFLCRVQEEINNEHIRTFSVPERYGENNSACHILGYVNADGQGVSGIEKAYNQYLTESGGSLTVSFQVDAVGRVLAGMDKTVSDINFSSKAGVVLSLDSRIQEITAKALEESRIESGAAIVTEAGTGELLSVASVPAFDPDDIAAALQSESSPLLNKAFSSYSVGSVFKSIVAAEALEEGISPDFSYECTGEITVGDTCFSCYNGTAHGTTDMKAALESSCNTYFINLIGKIDADRLLKLCRLMGFGEGTALAPDINSSSGTLPTAEELRSKGNLSNFSFGQGSFSATPLQIAQAYHCLCTGYSITPILVRGLTNSEGLMTKTAETEKEKLLSEETVKLIREMLASVVKSGMADKAKSSFVSLAGKTGTAQSGIYEDGEEICRTWFAGFFPSENPSYIVVVLCENGKSGSSDCAPVFKKICEGIIGAD